MWLQLVTCLDLVTDKDTGLWGMGTLKALEVLNKVNQK